MDSYRHAAQIMMGFVGKVKETYGYEAEELNLGGGFEYTIMKVINQPRLKRILKLL